MAKKDKKKQKSSNSTGNPSKDKIKPSKQGPSKQEPKSLKKKKKIREYLKLDCWHGLLPDEDTTEMLQEDGEYLVRSVEGCEIASIYVSVRWGQQILNIAIVHHEDGSYRFKGKSFNTIKELIDHHQVRKVPLPFDGDQRPMLGAPIHRKSWELRHGMVVLGKELGAGAYGTVYKGTLSKGTEKTPMDVAVKELSEIGLEASSSLWREARVMRDYDHPNVLKLYGVANDYMPFYLVMELVADGSVEDYFRKMDQMKKSISGNERLEVLVQAALGLEYLHSKGCIHRDIACRNLLIDLKGPVVKVADFGMTRRSSNYRIDPNKPMNLRWLAPEVYGTAVVKKSTDVYAFGVTIYECYTIPYDTPYKDWKPNAVYDKVVNRGYRLKPQDCMPRAVGELMTECLGPEPARPTFRTIVLCLKAFKHSSKHT